MSQEAAAEKDLAPEAVLSRLPTRRFGRAYEFLPACASTNDVVRIRAAAGAAEGLVIVADSQTAGRGRLGRSWHSPAGQNLYFSLLLRPALPAPPGRASHPAGWRRPGARAGRGRGSTAPALAQRSAGFCGG